MEQNFKQICLFTNRACYTISENVYIIINNELRNTTLKTASKL